MERVFRRYHILIKIDIAVFVNKAIDLTFRCGEGLCTVFLCVYRYVSWAIGTIIISDLYEICSEILLATCITSSSEGFSFW